MPKKSILFAIFALVVTAQTAAFGQAGKGTIAGQVKDTQLAALPGARVVLEPQVRPVVSDGQGAFTITDVTPGTYAVTISYVGFATFGGSVTVVAGQTAHLDAVLKVASASEEVIVTGERLFGEAEAINRTRAAENILQVLPAEVITSLPNANIADALGRMASVTIERDEGEGKYVQIRGTEPRLSNTMVDGVTIPSPESGVRQIKLDTIASDLVDSVEINKTLQANIDADGIGGSVNLVTKTASETPTIAVYGVGGYTHIIGGRTVSQFGTTIGRRFLTDKKLGVLIGGTYDFNGRGINDLEPVPTQTSATPHYDTMDFRDYVYYRTRYGATGSADYKLSEGSNISVRGLFSTFRNWGNKWVFTLNDGSTPQYSQDWRRPNLAIGSLALQGNHLFNVSTVKWNVSVSRSRSLGGSGGANYSWVGPFNSVDGNGNPIYSNCFNDESQATSVYRPGWNASGCGRMSVPSTNNVFDKNNYGLTEYDLPTFGQSVQLNLQASASYSRLYHFGSRYGTFEFGGKIRNAHKFDDTYNSFYTYDTPEPIASHPEWNGTFTDPLYYDGTYGKYPAVTDWVKVGNWVHANQGTFNGGPGVNSNNFDLVERIPAGYLMNTIELASRVRLVTGVRFEATHVSTLSFDGSIVPPAPPPTTLTFKAGGDYFDALPSASLRFAIDKDSDLRLVYGRGLSRPDPQDISAAVGQPVKNQGVYSISLGNPALTAEHANNYDILYERFLNPLGLIQAGYFYKDLTSPIINTQFYSTATYPGIPAGQKVLVSQPKNAGSAHVQGVEIGFQQRLSYLPGVLGGAGISANYSYTQSSTNGIPDNAITLSDGSLGPRPDSPALLRQAPNSWNVSPTYDTKHFSMRVGMTFDDTMIYAYQWNGTADQVNDPALGVKGPSGDNYLYAHYQFDTQATYKMPKGFEVYAYGLNLNNEFFGFYQGRSQYVVQREYYHPTYAGGIRWNLHQER